MQRLRSQTKSMVSVGLLDKKPVAIVFIFKHTSMNGVAVVNVEACI